MSGESKFDRDQLLCCDAAHEAIDIIEQLRASGFVAYLAGGCVRDALLGKPPKDYDVATDAAPDEVRRVFGRARTLAFGASFGVIGVLPKQSRFRDSDEPTVQPTEVATFRSDGEYSDGRRPDSVHFGNAKEDALRRDFTINGLFYDPDQHQVIDFVGGEEDLQAGMLRTIGDAAKRIEEDKLRMLRAVRFATTLGFEMHPDTIAAITTHAGEIAVVSGERIGAEMRRVLTAPGAVEGLRHLSKLGLDREVLPELQSLDWQQCEATLAQMTQPSFPVALAGILLAIPDAQAALRAVGDRWKLSNEECRQAGAAIKHWMIFQNAETLPWSQVQPVLVDRDADVIVAVAAAIVAASQADPGGIELIRDALDWPVEKRDPAPLLTGDDLKERGIPAGPAYARILKTLRERQLNGELSSRDDAIAALPHLT